jgi:2-iminobutanoate/2-iminopropanoate deaminase
LNDVYRRHFDDPAPARTAFQVAGLPAGALVEVDVIAALADGSGPRQG